MWVLSSAAAAAAGDAVAVCGDSRLECGARDFTGRG